MVGGNFLSSNLADKLTQALRNFIFNQKYSAKDPGKYHALEIPGHSNNSAMKAIRDTADEYVGSVTRNISWGMSKLMGSGESSETPREPNEEQKGEPELPHIQLTRR